MRSDLEASAIPEDVLYRLHPERLDEVSELDRFFRAALADRVAFTSATSRQAEEMSFRLVEIGSHLRFEGPRPDRSLGSTLFLNCQVAGRPYFLSLSVVEVSDGTIGTKWPKAIYRAERRDRSRRAIARRVPVRLSFGEFGVCDGLLQDVSADGMAVSISADGPVGRTSELVRIEASEGGLSGQSWTRVVGVRREGQWQRLGLELLPSRKWSRIQVSNPLPVAQPVRELGGILEPNPEVRWLPTPSGDPLAAIVDTVGERHGSAAIVIPPAWGKTKETLLALAGSLLASANRNGMSLTVVRFDGRDRKGESSRGPESFEVGLENLHYTFSQGARDISAVGRFLRADREFECSQVQLLTFSVAAIEGRRALAEDELGDYSSWISVVGATDPQSLIRVISGGVDYLGGAERGEQFGRQFVQGLLLDIDHAASDALSQRIAFLSDSKRDFDKISVPTTWFHGEHDAWASLDRVVTALSSGSAVERRLHVVPTGHQLKSSAEAARVFGMVSAESMRLLGCSGDSVGKPVAAELRARARAEKRRLKRPEVDTRSFWTDYLLGRDRSIGFELVTGTSSFRQLMRDQIAALGASLETSGVVVDLGSGTGAFLRELSASATDSPWVIELDYVVSALARTKASTPYRGRVSYLGANLDLRSRAIPLRAKVADAAICSLVVNYLADPVSLLEDIVRVLRPGGRLVLSALREDADTSRICVRGIAELRAGGSVSDFGPEGERRVDEALPGFVSEAGRLLDLEERGVFRLWSATELVELLGRVGLENVSITDTFGSPPQAWLVTGQRS